MSFTCKICREVVEDLPTHLKEAHHISTWEYSNLILSAGGISNKIISPCFPGISEEGFFEDLQRTQEDIKTDKTMSCLFCIKNLYEISQTGNITELSGLLRRILGNRRINKNVYLGLSIVPGYPKEISDRNLLGIRIIPIEMSVSKDLIVSLDEFRFRIVPLEQCGYDMRHHNRYSILSVANKKSTRYSKRIKLDGNLCYKFWNNQDFPETKSIFRILDPETDEIIDPRLIPDQLLGFLKQVILSNKVTSGILWSIYNEVVKYTNVLDDRVLLRNTITIPGKSKIKSRIIWSPVKNELTDGVNLSIL